MDGGTGENIVLHKRVRAGYLEMARQESGRWVVIDAGRVKWEEVQEELRKVVEERLHVMH
jgi:thymidylate kinase